MRDVKLLAMRLPKKVTNVTSKRSLTWESVGGNTAYASGAHLHGQGGNVRKHRYGVVPVMVPLGKCIQGAYTCALATGRGVGRPVGAGGWHAPTITSEGWV